MRMRILLPAAAALLSLAPPAAAQTPATAEETARAFLAAMDAGRWDAVAGLILPAEVQRQRDQALSRAMMEIEAEGGAGQGTVVVPGSATVDPEKLRRFGARPIRPLRGAATLAQAAALEPREFLARFMESVATPPPGTAATPRTHQYIGVLVENDSVAHALFREHGGQPRDPLAAEVLELRRLAGRWYVALGTPMFVRASLLPEGE